MFIEISLNYTDFTYFLYVEMLTSLFSFSLRILFYLRPCLKGTLYRLKSYNDLSRFCLCDQLFPFRDSNVLDFTNFQVQVHHRKFLRENVVYSFQCTLQLSVFILEVAASTSHHQIHWKQELAYLSNIF